MASTSSLPMAYYPQHAYFPSPTQHLPQQQPPASSSLRKCSVKNCNTLLPQDYSGKMCHECRGRHRIYASTKRAKRKMEKLAVNTQANDADEGAVFLPPDVAEERSHTHTPQTQADQPLPAVPAPDSSYAVTWEASQVDPRLFQSSSSELAGALTLPPLNPPTEDEEDDTPDPDSSILPRYCSIKGCKRIISGDYLYKMCQQCRTRYRAYGTAKRAKWKRDRELALTELERLRAVEEERRAAEGLTPLADLPDNERKAWDETQMPGMPPTPPRDPEPLVLPPVRMCTVSHCHTVLTGDYEYRRCEQHRMQNRHHSKLKRVRDKEEKAIPILDERATEQERAAYEAMKRKTAAGEDLSSEDGPLRMDARRSIPPPARGLRRTNHICNIRHCYNLLATQSPWKMCEFHREKDREARRRKAEQDAEKSQEPPGEDMDGEADDQDLSAIVEGQIASSKADSTEDLMPIGSPDFPDHHPSDIVFMEPLFPPDMVIPDMVHPGHEQASSNAATSIPSALLAPPPTIVAESSAPTSASDTESQPTKKRKRAPFKRRNEDVWKVATPLDMAAHTIGSSVPALESESPSDASGAGASAAAPTTSKKRKRSPSSMADPPPSDSRSATATSTPMLAPTSVPAPAAVSTVSITTTPSLGQPAESSTETPAYTVPPPAPNGTVAPHMQPQFQLPYYMPPPFGLSYTPGQPPFYTPSPFAPIPFPRGRGAYTHVMYQPPPPAQPSPFTTQAYAVPTLSAAWAGYGNTSGASSSDATSATTAPAAPAAPASTKTDDNASPSSTNNTASRTSAPRKARVNNLHGELTVNMYDPNAKPPRKRRKAVVDTSTLASGLSAGAEQSGMAVFSTNPVPTPMMIVEPPPMVGLLPDVPGTRAGTLIGQTRMAPLLNPSLPHTTADQTLAPRLCANNTCHREIPQGTANTLCDRCKMRLKKRQEKARQRMKLEPMKGPIGKLRASSVLADR